MNLDDDYDTLDELPAPPQKEIPAADRELLELAARALGAVRVEDVDGEEWLRLHFEDGTVVYAWNPLLHSDDAFGLACEVLDAVRFGTGFVIAEGSPKDVTEDFDQTDKSACRSATRRAITRAAAKIGKAMQ